MTQPTLFASSNVVHVSPVATELRRRESGKDAILRRLERGPATNIELGDIARRYSARIEELRKSGYRISSVGSGRDWTFTLLGRY